MSTIVRRYWETVRHLRPVQIYGRLWFRATNPRPDLRDAPPLRAIIGPWLSPAERRQSQVGPDSFVFLNEAGSLVGGWDDRRASKLWRYNLHYFDDLNAAQAGERTTWHSQLIARWVAENPPGARGTGWEPYPTSLRIVNWVKWARAGNQLPAAAVHSLAVQARWLAVRLERHLLGNHLFANAKALVFAGCFFEGREADRWLGRGLGILERELSGQVLADGGHFELSPMYHALALEDLLDLVNLCSSVGRPIPGPWPDAIVRMRAWLSAMSHPDGEIAFFNDAAIGVSPPPGALHRYAERLGYTKLPNGPGCLHLKESGYIRLAGRDAVALLDVARIGPDYLPGHAHADSLSFELSLRGQRCLVNSGTSVYGTGPERLRQRGTSAHNTIAVDGQDSSEVWSGFRVARRASPVGLEILPTGNGCRVSCAHDGYRWLPGRPRHRRTWHLSDTKLTVSDDVTGQTGHSEAAFHFHPDFTPEPLSVDVADGALKSRGETTLSWRVTGGRARIEPATWHPEFGLSLASHRLVVDLVDGTSEVTFAWG